MIACSSTGTRLTLTVL
uniref:Uncharacterized protein n=1 Tax=Anguilla anguilla TaxID=7936 RepID=A0A0E9RBM1_ANGAN